jgi:hypothetical protein
MARRCQNMTVGWKKCPTHLPDVQTLLYQFAHAVFMLQAVRAMFALGL